MAYFLGIGMQRVGEKIKIGLHSKIFNFKVCQVGMLEKYFMCLDFIARQNISSTLPLECIPTQKIRKFCCPLFCGLILIPYIN